MKTTSLLKILECQRFQLLILKVAWKSKVTYITDPKNKKNKNFLSEVTIQAASVLKKLQKVMVTKYKSLLKASDLRQGLEKSEHTLRQGHPTKIHIYLP